MVYLSKQKLDPWIPLLNQWPIAMYVHKSYFHDESPIRWARVDNNDDMLLPQSVLSEYAIPLEMEELILNMRFCLSFDTLEQDMFHA